MPRHLFAALAATALISTVTALAVPAADAGSAPPPMPTSTNGNAVQLVASGLKTPTSFAFDGSTVFVGDGGNSEGSAPPNGGVYVLKGGTAVLIPSNVKFVSGLAWHDNALYISGGVLTRTGPSWRLMKWSGWNGSTFAHQAVLWAASHKFQGFNGIAFGTNGRLYVGADVGLTNGNDHGPKTTSPHVYEMFSFRADGSDRQIFARGIRQPWQMVFRAGANSPYVTDLGQDSGAKNPRDFLLHVRAGQNYGFPTCNGTVAKACTHFAKPYRTFGPHTDLMGIAAHGQNFYLSSFLGRMGKGPGGEVFSLNVHGGPLKPLMTGFVAPTVGLGLHHGYVYVGELTGQVFRVKI